MIRRKSLAIFGYISSSSSFRTAGSETGCSLETGCNRLAAVLGSAGLMEAGFRAYSQPSFPYNPIKRNKLIVRKQGVDILHDPVLNKGTAFRWDERERLGLRGLLPPKVLTLEQQLPRAMEELLYGRDFIGAGAVADVTPEDVRKWRSLTGLQDRNETIFYHVLLNNFAELAPIIYTPTVGWACLNFHRLYRRPRGMYFSAIDRGQMHAMVWNWPENQVDAIVVTDGSRILGLGDLGVNGLGISIGKLDLYVAGAGFSPSRILPCVVDVGTDNEALRSDHLYLGLDRPRAKGEEYYAVMDEFVSAVMSRWPDAVLQFEDFSTERASTLLHRYRNTHLAFNDDIQGTACTALAGLYGALRVQGLPVHAIAEQRILVLGAGSAGMGVVDMISKGMQEHSLTAEDAARQFWVVDVQGLVTEARGSALSKDIRPFARAAGGEDKEGERFLDVVRRVKPTILIGLSGAGRLFTREVLQAMSDANPDRRPVIFPMSNPTSKMECTSEDAQRATNGRAIFASGSPQPAVVWDGRLIPSSQANNMYIFPGVAFGAHLGKTGVVSDAMLMAAAEALPNTISDADLQAGHVYPRLSHIREISATISREVMKTAYEEGHLNSQMAQLMVGRGDAALDAYIKDNMYKPEYGTMIRLDRGVGE